MLLLDVVVHFLLQFKEVSTVGTFVRNIFEEFLFWMHSLKVTPKCVLKNIFWLKIIFAEKAGWV